MVQVRTPAGWRSSKIALNPFVFTGVAAQIAAKADGPVSAVRFVR